VFSAFGISFSDIGRSYEVGLTELTAEAAATSHDALVVRAERDMFQEGHELAACSLTWTLAVEDDNGDLVRESPFRHGDAPLAAPGQHASLKLEVTAALPHAELAAGADVEASSAVASGNRRVRSSGTQVDDVPVYSLVDQTPGATANGPAIVEGPYFTARVLEGWQLEVTSNGDLILTDIQ
jgi:N-methylhydantoinase A/oxoprolinase/acetone carboxylase beta subunit